MAKKEKTFDAKGREICGAKTKSKIKGDKKTPRTNKVCNRSPMANGRCHLHGGKSTGPKNSIAYYRKIIREEEQGALDIENPMDLVGELGFVRQLLTKMMDDPLKAYCQDCRQWVHVDITCPNKEYQNKVRLGDGKRPLNHHVAVKDNDFSSVVKATKLLSDIAKNHKEIQKGKEITVRVEIINLIVAKVIEAYEESDKLADPGKRRELFVNRLERLILEPAQTGLAQAESKLT